MVRSKLAAAILSASLVLPGVSSALGLGDYTNKSYLNQPLDLEIPLIQTKDLTPDEVVANLATQEEFDRAGIERSYALQDLRFEVEQGADGSMKIVAHTSKPVTEPFLNFLLEVRWPQGRMLREYTILLDPQVYKAGAAPAATAEPVTQQPEQPPAQPAAATAPAPAVAQPPPSPAVSESGLPPPPSGAAASASATEPSVAATKPSQPAPAAAAPPSAKAGEYRVQANDTMWQIAAQNHGAATVQQTMIAIQRANSDAFIKGNVNLVKKGAVLRIPGDAEIQQVGTKEARTEFASQTKAWRELLDQRGIARPADKAALEAGKSVASHAAPSKGTGKGEVTLVSPTASGKGKASGGKEAEALQNQLAISEEGIAKATAENKELSTHLTDLDKQIKASDKTLAMKSDEITRLQDELNRLRKDKEKAAQTATTAAPKPAETAPAAETAAPAPAPKPEVAKAEAAKPEKKPVAEEQPSPPPSSGGSMIGLLAGVVALLGAAGGGFWFWRRRQAAPAAVPTVSEDHDAQVADDLAQLQDLHAGTEDHEAPVAAPHEGEGGDPLGEADMYMAYGRFQQAADILYAALQREPERGDIRVKLAEVYAEMGDTDSAREHATTAAGSSNADIRRQAEAVLAKVGGGATASAAEEKLPSLDDLALEFSGGTPAAAPAASEELSFDLDEPATATAKTPAVSAPRAQPAAPAKAEKEEEESLDFSLDDIDMGEAAPAPAPKAAGSTTEVRAKQDFGDLSLDDSGFGDFKLEEEEKPAAAAVKEFDLSEELSLEEAPAPTEELTMEAPAFEEPDFAATTGAQPKLTDKMAAKAAPAPAAPALDLESELADLHTDLKQEGVAAAGSSADDFDFLADSDENATKLDLAKAYIDMGDADGARDILNEVVAEGNATQKSEAQKLLAQVG